MATESKNDPNEAINHSLNINEVIASTSLAAESVLFSATALENPSTIDKIKFFLVWIMWLHCLV